MARPLPLDLDLEEGVVLPWLVLAVRRFDDVAAGWYICAVGANDCSSRCTSILSAGICSNSKDDSFTRKIGSIRRYLSVSAYVSQ